MANSLSLYPLSQDQGDTSRQATRGSLGVGPLYYGTNTFQDLFASPQLPHWLRQPAVGVLPLPASHCCPDPVPAPAESYPGDFNWLPPHEYTAAVMGDRKLAGMIPVVTGAAT